MTIQLPPEVEARLSEEAHRRGVAPTDFAAKLIEQGLPRSAAPGAGPNQAAIELLKRWEQENATDDPAELARRQKEYEEFKEAMNRNRLEMEGPSARKVYP
jgi:hypothetical protein